MWFFILVVIVGIVIVQNIRIVAQAHCYVIERLGKFHGVWQAGIHVKVPVIDRVVAKISLKEQVFDFPPQSVITRDNVTMQIDSVVYAKVYNAEHYTYGVDNPLNGLQNLTATTLRSIIGEMDLDSTLSSRDEINRKMQAILDDATDKWGLKVIRVEIKNITPPDEIEAVMTKQMRAERERRQTVLEAEAYRESVMSRAEGDKQAKLLAAESERDAAIALAEGRAKAISLVYAAEAEGIQRLAVAGITDGVLRLKSIEAMKDVADGQATKIFIPNDLSQALASAGTVGEVMGLGQPMSGGVPRRQQRVNDVRQAAYTQVRTDPTLRSGSTEETYSAAKSNAKVQKGLEKRNTQ